MDEQVGFRALIGGFRENLPKMVETMPYMPGLLYDVSKQASQGRLTMQWESKQIHIIRKELATAQRNTRLTLVGATLLIVASLTTDSLLLPPLLGIAPLSLALGAIGAGLLLYGTFNKR